jgi:predicted HicB family RNase H-like nuclease
MKKTSDYPRFTIRISEDLHQWLKGYAKRNDISMSRVVKQYLESLRREDLAAKDVPCQSNNA